MRERLVAKEWNKVPQETYNAKPRSVAWVDASRHVDETDDECVRGMIITNSSCDGVDYE